MTEYYHGYTIALAYDQDADDPLDWTTPAERGAWFALDMQRRSLPWELEDDHADYTSWQEVVKTNAEQYGGVYKFVRWYEHGGIAVSLRDDEGGQDWDAGIAGVIFGGTTAAIQASFAGWKAYVEGDVYALTVTAPDGNEADSLVGLYGYAEALDYAHSVIDEDAKLTGVARVRRYGRAHAPRARELHV
jgi:hypothetical protein